MYCLCMNPMSLIAIVDENFGNSVEAIQTTRSCVRVLFNKTLYGLSIHTHGQNYVVQLLIKKEFNKWNEPCNAFTDYNIHHKKKRKNCVWKYHKSKEFTNLDEVIDEISRVLKLALKQAQFMRELDDLEYVESEEEV